ncbi:MAG: hypothetical protein PHG65_07300, partial [Kiritimatiellae bacterium]|nr:hypothetical protein [Kiritimatiellia bacterium]
MTQSRYNPEIHHRRSIRLKGHDYAGGGLYFVTICAHRDAGTVFAAEDVKDMVAREWESAVGAGLVSAPPVSTPPVSTPPVSTPPVSAPPVSTPRREEGGHKARREEGGHKARREEGGHKARPYAI